MGTGHQMSFLFILHERVFQITNFIKAFSYTFHEYSENPPEGKITEIRLSIVQKLDLCMKQSVLAMKMMYTSIITVNVKPGLRGSTKIFQAKATEE